MSLVYFFLAFSALIDVITWRIPNLLVAGVVGAACLFDHPQWLQGGGMFLFLLTLKKGMKWYLQEEGMGMGDVKLMSACALFFTWEQCGFFLCATGICAVMMAFLFCRRVLPFAPAIFAGFVLTYKGWPCVKNMIV